MVDSKDFFIYPKQLYPNFMGYILYIYGLYCSWAISSYEFEANTHLPSNTSYPPKSRSYLPASAGCCNQGLEIVLNPLALANISFSP